MVRQVKRRCFRRSLALSTSCFVLLCSGAWLVLTEGSPAASPGASHPSPSIGGAQSGEAVRLIGEALAAPEPAPAGGASPERQPSAPASEAVPAPGRGTRQAAAGPGAVRALDPNQVPPEARARLRRRLAEKQRLDALLISSSSW